MLVSTTKIFTWTHLHNNISSCNRVPNGKLVLKNVSVTQYQYLLELTFTIIFHLVTESLMADLCWKMFQLLNTNIADPFILTHIYKQFFPSRKGGGHGQELVYQKLTGIPNKSYQQREKGSGMKCGREGWHQRASQTQWQTIHVFGTFIKDTKTVENNMTLFIMIKQSSDCKCTLEYLNGENQTILLTVIAMTWYSVTGLR